MGNKRRELSIRSHLKKKRQAMALVRKNPIYKIKENIKCSEFIRKLRKNPEFQEMEKKRNFRKRERKLDSEQKRCTRENELFRFREQFTKSVKNENNDAKKDFLDSRLSRPEFICCCCVNLLFRHSVIKFNEGKLFKI